MGLFLYFIFILFIVVSRPPSNPGQLPVGFVAFASVPVSERRGGGDLEVRFEDSDPARLAMLSQGSFSGQYPGAQERPAARACGHQAPGPSRPPARLAWQSAAAAYEEPGAA